VKKQPGFWWLLFYGRRRRGFPWLLAGVAVVIVGFALLFAIPGGADVSRTIAALVFGALLAAAFVLAVLAVLRPRRRP
jgi:Na+/melibiose symporter-like transporter